MNNLELIEPYLQGEIDPAYAQRARFIFEEIVKNKPEVALDTGCGRGFYVKLLSLFDFPKKISGIDLSDSHLEKARALVADQGDRVNLQKASIYELPFPDQSVDFLICSEVLEHLDNPDQAVKEIYRVLKKGAHAAITVPCKTFPFFWDPLNWLLMRLFGTHVNKDIHWLAGIWADHERLYDEETLRNHFKSGFEIVSSKNIVSTCWPFSHFFIYGIGKNLVERGVFTGLNRFTFEKPGLLKRALAKFMSLPSDLFDKGKNKKGTILFLCVKKT
jgi:ubiquinone/menaquinone biosynthesis C-methylase UbiE